MTEEEAQSWLDAHVPRGTRTTLNRYVALLLDAAERQNLLSAQTVPQIWARHIVDSAQLAPLVRGRTADVGSGAGLPGVVLAILGAEITLIEPRKLRAAFLAEVITALDLRATVIRRDVIKVDGQFNTIVARAYAPLDRAIATTLHLADDGTRWVLPKGRGATSELEVARAAWHGDFETVHSITDSQAAIVVAEHVRAKARA